MRLNSSVCSTNPNGRGRAPVAAPLHQYALLRYDFTPVTSPVKRLLQNNIVLAVHALPISGPYLYLAPLTGDY